MIYLEYPAIFTDSIGCEKCVLSLSSSNLKLKVRGFDFYSMDYVFDFYTKNKREVQKWFYLKDDELIEYILDVRIKIAMIYKNKDYMQKAILRIEREKNYYNNMIMFENNKKSYTVKGLDLKKILLNLNNKLPEGYNLKLNVLEECFID